MIEQNAPVYPLPLQLHTGVPSDITQTPAPHCTDAHAVTCSTMTVRAIVSITLAMFTVPPLLPPPPVDEPPVDTSPPDAADSDAAIAACACCSAATVAETVVLPPSVVLSAELEVDELVSTVTDDDDDDSCDIRSAIVGAVIVSCTPGCSIVSLPNALRTTTVTHTLLPFDGSCIS